MRSKRTSQAGTESRSGGGSGSSRSHQRWSPIQHRRGGTTAAAAAAISCLAVALAAVGRCLAWWRPREKRHRQRGRSRIVRWLFHYRTGGRRGSINGGGQTFLRSHQLFVDFSFLVAIVVRMKIKAGFRRSRSSSRSYSSSRLLIDSQLPVDRHGGLGNALALPVYIDCNVIKTQINLVSQRSDAIQFRDLKRTFSNKIQMHQTKPTSRNTAVPVTLPSCAQFSRASDKRKLIEMLRQLFAKVGTEKVTEKTSRRVNLAWNRRAGWKGEKYGLSYWKVVTSEPNFFDLLCRTPEGN